MYDIVFHIERKINYFILFFILFFLFQRLICAYRSNVLIRVETYLKGDFWIFWIFYIHYSALFHLPPLHFHCVGGCWDRTQACCDIGIDSEPKSHLIHHGNICRTLSVVTFNNSSLEYQAETNSKLFHRQDEAKHKQKHFFRNVFFSYF